MWKYISGFEGYYCVSDKGEVYSLRSHKILKPKKDHYGYLVVTLSVNQKRYTRTVHRLVAETFIPNISEKETVNHINENKTDNHVENLEWMSVKENNNHGTRNKRVSLTKSKKPVIREIDGKQEYFLGIKDASRKTGIAHSQIGRFYKDLMNKEWRYA